MSNGAYRLMELNQAWEFVEDAPAYDPIRIGAKNYPATEFSSTGVTTVATTAFLVCGKDTSDVLVNSVLDCMFKPEVRRLAGIHSPEQAAHWKGLAWHPAAKAFFNIYRSSNAN